MDIDKAFNQAPMGLPDMLGGEPELEIIVDLGEGLEEDGLEVEEEEDEDAFRANLCGWSGIARPEG
jgi:hypothetical protein